MVTHLPSIRILDGEKCMTSENSGGMWYIIIYEQCVGLMVGWLSNIRRKKFSYGVTHFGG